MNTSTKALHWVPSLYFFQGMPYIIVTILSTIFYKEFGISDYVIVMVTSWLFLPWVLKPIFACLIESVGSKRKWILAMEYLMALILFLLSASVSSPHFLPLTIGSLIALAVFSSCHDISSDGLYLKTLSIEEQYHYVGIRNACYQSARLMCQGLLITLVGYWSLHGHLMRAWQCGFFSAGLIMVLIACYHFFQLPDQLEMRIKKNTFLKTWLLTCRQIITECQKTPHLPHVLIFLLVFNAAEAQLLKIVPLFFMSSYHAHGLALNDFEMGLTQIIGVVSVICGAFILSYALKKFHIATLLQFSMLMLIVTNCVYWPMSVLPHHSIWLTEAGFVLAQFMFGVANSAYMAYLMHLVIDKEYKAAFYALGTALMSLSFLVFGLLSGMIKHEISYENFFIWIVLFSLFLFVYTNYFVKRSIKP